MPQFVNNYYWKKPSNHQTKYSTSIFRSHKSNKNCTGEIQLHLPIKLACKLIYMKIGGSRVNLGEKASLIVILLSEQVCKDGFHILARCHSRLCNRNKKWAWTFILTMQIAISKADYPLLQFFTGSLGIISF